MNIADIILNGITPINTSDNKVININELLDNTSNNTVKRDFTGEKYLSQNKQNIIPDKMSYQLFNKHNTNAISQIIYIGNSYFITIIHKDQYQTMSRLSNNYYVKYNDKRLNISYINSYPNNIENTYVIVILQVINNDPEYFEFNIINPSKYLSYEQKNIEVSYEINNNLHKNKILYITENNITLNNDNTLITGCPLFIDNVLLGIYYKKNANLSVFFRLSSIHNWLETFSLINKDLKIDKHIYVQYSKEQMYNIIIDMHNRITLLENTISEMNKINE
jgi:hypothetical protein